jgi:signal transduction histidine kinase
VTRRLLSKLINASRLLRWRLMALFVLVALGMSFVFMGTIQRGFSSGWRDAVRPIIADYVDRLASEIGTPPDIAKTQALASRLPISIIIAGPAVNFSTHPAHLHSDHKYRYPGAKNPLNEKLLRRVTTDGHTISFGLGDIEWRRGPGKTAWLLLAALLLILALTFLAVRRMLKPIGAISAGAERFGKGDFAEPVPVHSKNELGDLAHRINAMGGDIHAMLEAKRSLLLAISHELRSPLTRARLNTELLPETPETQTHRIALIKDLGEMNRLVGDLIESERLNERHASLNLEAVDLVKLAQAMRSEVTEPFDLSISGDVKSPAILQIDRVRISLMLKNLLSNAQRYNDPKLGQVKVVIEQSVGSARLLVRDFGAGVSPSALEHLGKAFYRPDDARQRSTGGTGLGLYLSELIAKAHGGSLAFRNAEPGLEVVATIKSIDR